MQVMTAGVHHAHLLSFRVGRFHRARIVQSGLLFYRQGIHVRSDQHPRSRAVLKHRYNAECLCAVLILPHMFCHRVPKLAKLCGQKCRRLLLMLRKLWIAVQMLVDFGECRR